MEYVYYTLVGLLALAGIVLVIVSLCKAVIFLSGKIDDWWDDRQRMNHREEIGLAHIQWSKDGDTGRIVTEKHKHHYEVIRAYHDRYVFVCHKDDCGDIAEIFRTYFWDGEKPTQQLYEEAIQSLREYWQTEKFDV